MTWKAFKVLDQLKTLHNMAGDCPTAECAEVLTWIDRFWFLALFPSFGQKNAHELFKGELCMSKRWRDNPCKKGGILA